MGTLYKKDEGLKTQDDTSSTTKKAWWRKPSQNGTFKSEPVLSTNNTTSGTISTLNWIERTEQKSIVQTTPMTNNTKSATLQTSQTANMSMPTTSMSQLTTEETSTQQADITLKHKSTTAHTKAGYLTTEDYSDILETTIQNNEKADSKGEATISDTSIQPYITDAPELSHKAPELSHTAPEHSHTAPELPHTAPELPHTAPDLYPGTKLVYQDTPLTEFDHKTDMVKVLDKNKQQGRDGTNQKEGYTENSLNMTQNNDFKEFVNKSLENNVKKDYPSDDNKEDINAKFQQLLAHNTKLADINNRVSYLGRVGYEFIVNAVAGV